MERLRCQESRNLTDKKEQGIYPGVRASLFDGLTLEEYIKAKRIKCNELHSATSCSCQSLIAAAEIVLKNRFTPLPVLWNTAFPSVVYDCEKAQRRLLQLPLVAFRYEGRVYISEKKEKMDYGAMMNELSQHLLCDQSKSYISSEDFFDVLKSTESDAERTRLKHVVCSGYNLSRRQASSIYKISRLKERATAVSEACQRAEDIKAMHGYLAKVEQRAFLNSLGVDCDAYLDSSSSEDDSEESEEEEEEEDITENDEEQVNGDDKISSQSFEDTERISSGIPKPMTGSCTAIDAPNSSVGHDGDNAGESEQHHSFSASPGKSLQEIDVNSVMVLDILREVRFNWFALVALLQPKFTGLYR